MPQNDAGRDSPPNILVLCIDQWDARMELPEGVELPALERLEAEGVMYENAYCTVPVCTPSRATMWTGVHAKETGLWDNTNFAWIHELSPELPTVGHMLRDLGYYTAFKGKWHLSEVEKGEDALERFGFSDFQQWGEMFGAPLQGEMLDGTAAFETVDWLENAATRLEQPWMLVASLVNPHDIMYLRTDPVETPQPEGAMEGLQTGVQRLGWFQERWDVTLPENFDDDYFLQPYGVRHYKEFIDRNYGRVPDERTDLWLERRNYLVNAMRLVDSEFLKILDAMDRLGLWENTVVFFTGDHGEMNGAPDFSRRTFYRCVVDGRYKLVRWFSPREYANPQTLEELYATGDVALYDLEEDPGELENLGHPDHPGHDPALVERMLEKLHALVERELGEDRVPFDLDLFGTRRRGGAEGMAA